MRRSRADGFSLIELSIVMAVALVGAAIIVPSFTAFSRSQRAKQGARIVESQLQTARLKAVATSRSLRVRLSCPSTDTLRILELTRVPAVDNATNRCSPTAFPFPGPRDSLMSTPAHDGPVVYLPTGVSVSGPAMHFEFNPRGTVYSVATNGVTTILAGDTSLSVVYGTWTQTVTINAVGRIKVN